MPTTSSPPAVLTIAGSDSGGGAGIQADLKTFLAHSTYGLSTIVALTAQNTQSVRSVFAVPAQMISEQLDAVFDDIDIKAAKTGMLMDRLTIETVADAWKRNANGIPLVVDPVMVATSGGRLLKEDAVEALRTRLLPVATLVTPNLREAEVLLDMKPNSIETVEAMEAAGRMICERFAVPVVVVKGGHLVSGPVTDVVVEGESGKVSRIENPRIDSTSTHGTGCTLSAAIAANLAKGMEALEAVAAGIKYVNQAIQAAYPVGHGHGPVNHAYALTTLSIPPPTIQTPYPFTAYLKANSNGLWDKYIRHSFVRQAGTGKLTRTAF
ncbi:trifunctional hydroxymethylpyrimidine kinase/phosphomethylpyrimidine kinase/thiaminase, partial [Linderina macrospora]